MPNEGNPQCQLQAPNRVTGATILNSATTTFQRSWSNSQELWRQNILQLATNFSFAREGPKK